MGHAYWVAYVENPSERAGFFFSLPCEPAFEPFFGVPYGVPCDPALGVPYDAASKNMDFLVLLANQLSIMLPRVTN